MLTSQLALGGQKRIDRLGGGQAWACSADADRQRPSRKSAAQRFGERSITSQAGT